MGVALTQFTVDRSCPGNATEKAMRAGIRRQYRLVAYDRSHRSRANGEIGKKRLNSVSIQRRLQQRFEGLLHQRAPVFASDHESAFDLPAFDQARRYGERIKKTETGIRDVENLGCGRQPDFAMCKGSGGGLQHVPAHRAVDK